MRVMVLVKATEDSESGRLPETSEFEEMHRYNEELVKAGILLAADGLRDSSHGKRVRFGASKGSTTVVDGPFAETKELVSGFWLWEVSSMDEAVEWVKRAPFTDQEIEVRRIFEAEDFGETFTEDLKANVERMREDVAQRGSQQQ